MKITLYFLILKYFNKIKHQSLVFTALLSACCICSVSGSTKAQNATESKISLKLSNVNLIKGLTAVEDKAGCVINYNPAIFKTDRHISIDVKDMRVAEVVKKMLEGTGVMYKINDPKTILLYKLPDPVKQGKISGKILDEKGEPLPGAGIKIVELNRTVSTGVDGSFSISVDPGNYTVEIRYVSYQPRRVTDVTVKSGENTPLSISMKPASETLAGVVITGGYKKTSTEGLLAKQKNAAELSNGISAEQISKTPDANLGEALKRITGISTVDNKYVIVRGMGERYNAATLDGAILPSTEIGKRAFAFDLIPSNLIDNVTVSKTITPDMNATFAGGLVQINTKDIPDEDFTSVSIGSSVNDNSIGKDFYSPQRGKYDYLGFDDGRRDFPKNLRYTTDLVANRPDAPRAEDKYAQSRLFTRDNLSLYKTPAFIGQNYQFTIGRAMKLDTSNVLGIVGSLSYRNTQNITDISDARRGNFLIPSDNYGNSYNFNTTWGAILNAGLKLKNHRVSLRNTYTRKFENNTSIINNHPNDISEEELKNGVPQRQRVEVNPTFLDLLQNKLGLQHQLGKLKLEWDIARTGIVRNQKDVVRRDLTPVLIDGVYVLRTETNSTQTGDFPISRHHYLNKETDYSWNISGMIPFNLANTRHTLKTGYGGIKKHLTLNWAGAQLNHSLQTSPELFNLPLSERIKTENLNPNGYVWEVQPFLLDAYEGKSKQHTGYFMFDNRFNEQFRLVWGLRMEYYKYDEIRNPSNSKEFAGGENNPNEVKDPVWRWLPSANFTYSPTQKLNLRLAFSRTVIRPEFVERARFQMYNPDLNANVYSLSGLTSTRVDGLDFRAELFPDLGETISVGAFYRYFDKPVEISKQPALDGRNEYVTRNSISAKNFGLELELRKNLTFIGDQAWLRNLTLFGNATYIRSEVTQATVIQSTGEASVPSKNKRPLYGQTPYLINVGVQYEAKQFGMNFVYNRTGRKMYVVASKMRDNEYQMPFNQLDAQLSYKFLKPKLELKLNLANLLDQKIQYYDNTGSYRQAMPEDGIPLENTDQLVKKAGFTDNYENGDTRTFTQRIGRSFGLQLNYNF
ncbi:TonB-dependent receptor [Pedobacter caeni]|uniref:Outer membrane receptor proteins, mostly Fe transport n=1 Tax=Pedobacter caeni TaxID=288992 RepID=A0A1M5G6M0_9SPHI|nr:TonB-dependent receptor [Pedobacter caeni]SHF99368.1 Outer membrane receptor proteins, mostly Fe transport [Pedobacter caeni]